MPEGPSIIILRGETTQFIGKTVINAIGNSKIDKSRLVAERIVNIRSWGKHFLIEFERFSVRIHFLLFGSYLINARKDMAPRLTLQFDHGEMNFYSCSVRFIEEPLDTVYDWSADVMSDSWNPAQARVKLREQPSMFACDALLNQNIFAGVGNIIKNEVLFRVRVHPLSLVGALSPRKLNELIKEAREYSFQFLEWKKAYVLRKHWLAHTKNICPRCEIPFSKGKLGRTQRRSFYCEKCQIKYTNLPKSNKRLAARKKRVPKSESRVGIERRV